MNEFVLLHFRPFTESSVISVSLLCSEESLTITLRLNTSLDALKLVSATL